MSPYSRESAPAFLNIPLLDRLRAASDFVPAAELAEPGGRLRLADDLDALEAFGFEIERHPYLGAAYRGPASRLCPDQIEHELGVRRIGRRIAVWNRLGSTNDVAARGARATANDGLVVLAEEQTTGRGQRGRIWTAPPRSCILMSVLLFPPAQLSPIGRDSPGGGRLADRVGRGGHRRASSPNGPDATRGSNGPTTSASRDARSPACWSSAHPSPRRLRSAVVFARA